MIIDQLQLVHSVEVVEGQELQEECLEDLEDSNIIAVVFNHRYLFLKKELLKVDQENKILIGYKPELKLFDIILLSHARYPATP